MKKKLLYLVMVMVFAFSLLCQPAVVQAAQRSVTLNMSLPGPAPEKIHFQISILSDTEPEPTLYRFYTDAPKGATVVSKQIYGDFSDLCLIGVIGYFEGDPPVIGEELKNLCDLIIDLSEDVVNINIGFPDTKFDFDPPFTPDIDAVGEGDVSVTGRAEAGSTIIVSKDGTVIGKGITGADNSYSVTIPPQKLGTVIKVVSVDAAGNESVSVETTVRDKVPPEKPVVNSIGDNSTSVSGSAEPGSTVCVKKDNEVLGTVKAGADEKFTVAIPVQAAGTKLVISATDEAGNESEQVEIQVTDTTPPVINSVNDVYDTDMEVTGTVEEGATVYVLAGDSSIGTATSGPTGFKVSIPAQKAGTELNITAEDKAGNKHTVSVTVLATEKPEVKDTVPPSPPKVNAVYTTSKTITGKAEPGSIIAVKKAGKVIGTVKAGNNGSFTLKISPLKKGTVIEVTAKDAAGNTSKVTKVTVKVKSK